MGLEMYKEGHLGGYIKGGDPQTWCPHLWNWAVSKFHIRSVLDIGCGEGHSTKFLKDKGCEVLGIEGTTQAIHDSPIPEDLKQHDFSSGAFVSSRKFNMVWCCEFVEHVDEKFLGCILETFNLSDKVILMTHADLRQKDGYHHVNCQEGRYWIKHVESLGFVCHKKWTEEAREISLKDYPGINHFARSGLVFARPSVLSKPQSLSNDIPAFLKARFIEWSFKGSSAYRLRKKEMRARKLQKKRMSQSK